MAGKFIYKAAEFTSFVALFNLYVYTLAVVYLPSGLVARDKPYRHDRLGMQRLEDEATSPSYTIEEEELNTVNVQDQQ